MITPMKKRTTRKQLVLEKRAQESGPEEPLTAPECAEGDEHVVEVPNSMEPETPFVPFPLVPIEEGGPLLYCDSCCRCGCLRMPRELEGGFCLHCGHLYQTGDPDFLKSQAEHCAHCRPFQEYAHPGSRTLPARCGAPVLRSSKEQLEVLDQAISRLYWVVHAVNNYIWVEKLALEGRPVDGLRQHAIELLSEYVQKGRG